MKNSSLTFNKGSRFTITKQVSNFFIHCHAEKNKTTKNLRTKYANDDDNDELNFREFWTVLEFGYSSGADKI